MNLFREKIREKIADNNLQIALDGNAARRLAGRTLAIASLPDWAERRQKAHAIRAEVIENLDQYLAQFVGKVQETGITVHRAKDAADAVRIVLEIVKSSPRSHQDTKNFAPLSLRGETENQRSS